MNWIFVKSNADRSDDRLTFLDPGSVFFFHVAYKFAQHASEAVLVSFSTKLLWFIHVGIPAINTEVSEVWRCMIAVAKDLIDFWIGVI